MAGPSVVLAAYTHFGATGLKGVGMYHLVRDLWREGHVRRVIAVSRRRCRFPFDQRLVQAMPGEAKAIHALGAIQRWYPGFPSRWLGESLFDRFAAARLPAGGGVLITTPGMPRTAARGRALGYTNVMYSSTAEPTFVAETIRTERQRFGVQETESGRRPIFERFARQLAITDHVMVLSEFARRTYSVRGVAADRLWVVPLGVDIERYRPTPPPDGPPTFLFMGHVNLTTGLTKGLQYLLQAWDTTDVPGGRLVVCGKIGPEARALVDRHRGAPGLLLAGEVADAAPRYQASHALVFPSLADSMGKVMLEAMASARPVILTPNTGAVVREGVDGYYVPVRDPGALRDRMRELAGAPASIARMGARARERAQEFTWDRFSARVAARVRQVAA
jgi:glycosyltransferase involved in cell wall biosynthesis